MTGACHVPQALVGIMRLGAIFTGLENHSGGLPVVGGTNKLPLYICSAANDSMTTPHMHVSLKVGNHRVTWLHGVSCI